MTTSIRTPEAPCDALTAWAHWGATLARYAEVTP
jgi:hypothetical protein